MYFMKFLFISNNYFQVFTQ